MRITESKIRQIIRQEAQRVLGEASRLDPSRDPDPPYGRGSAPDEHDREAHLRYIHRIGEPDDEPSIIETVAQQIIDEVGKNQAKIFYNEIAAGSSDPDPEVVQELAGLISRFSGVPGMGSRHNDQIAVLDAISNIIRGPGHRRRYQ